MAWRTDGRQGRERWEGGRPKTILLLASLGIALSGCGGKSTGEWVEQLRCKDSAQRLHAVNALGERRGDAAVVVPALVRTLQDEDAFVRRDAATALGKLGAEAKTAVPALLTATQDKNRGVRQEAARALKRIDPEAAAGVGVR